jgi:hypothetical protein
MPGNFHPPPQCWIEAECEWDPKKNTAFWPDLPIVEAQFEACWHARTCGLKGREYTDECPAPCALSGWCDKKGHRTIEF